MGQVIHSNHCQMHDLDEWPWNAKSQDFARDISYIDSYADYSNEFVIISNVLWVR